MADFLQVFSVMGFPAAYYGLAITTVLFHLAFTLSYIKTAMSWALHFAGVADPGEPNSSSSTDFHDTNSASVRPSISADTIRKNLPVVTFGKFADRFCEPMGDDIMCAVCLSSFEEKEQIRELCNCHHIFHRNCLDKWLDHRQTTCPLCRSSLMPERILDTEVNKSWIVDRIAYIFDEDIPISS